MGGGTPRLEEAAVEEHHCWSYPDDATLYDGLERFVRTGLREGQRIVARISTDRVEDAQRHLGLTVSDARDAERRGALIVQAAREAYAPGGAFDPDEALSEVRDLASRATAEGYRALRLLTEVSELKDHPTFLAQWPRFEVRADVLRATGDLIARCAYDARRCSGSTMELLRSLHPSSNGPFAEDPPFRIHATPTGGLALRGEVDLLNAATVAALGPVLAGDLSEPVLDVSALRSVDVTGMRAVAETLEAMSSRFSRVTIRGASRTFTELWESMMLDRRVPALIG